MAKGKLSYKKPLLLNNTNEYALLCADGSAATGTSFGSTNYCSKGSSANPAVNFSDATNGYIGSMGTVCNPGSQDSESWLDVSCNTGSVVGSTPSNSCASGGTPT